MSGVIEPCRFCGGNMHIKARVCKHCGKERAPSDEPAAPADEGGPAAALFTDEAAAIGPQPDIGVVPPPPPGPDIAQPIGVEEEAGDRESDAASRPAPQTPPPVALDPLRPHIAIGKFMFSYGGGLQFIREGQIISETNVIAAMRAANLPVRPVDEAEGYVCCPDCGTQFRPTGEALRRIIAGAGDLWSGGGRQRPV